ncbi:MAG: helix-turn-helix domain-containing protein [Candidatus Sungbacteria bacterium]|uniref:Helix-turn-helix domain-containing protein n=1 Tax=Candidatus Sungiibacteriota bacterium TaxID=2750080 RepID=A0A9D6LRQ3_9BACT|nr:helix-turn-helix domain-containing protein [Candidatus Sungbacteria bacterium]
MLANVKLESMPRTKQEKRGIPELLTLKEACAVLKCHPNTLRQWDTKGILKAIRIGIRKDRRYQKDDILKLLKKK